MFQIKMNLKLFLIIIFHLCFKVNANEINSTLINALTECQYIGLEKYTCPGGVTVELAQNVNGRVTCSNVRNVNYLWAWKNKINYKIDEILIEKCFPPSLKSIKQLLEMSKIKGYNIFSMTDSDLTNITTKTFSNFENLKEFSLRVNILTHFPIDFFKTFQNVKYFNFENNQIMEISFELKNLLKLNLKKNKLKNIEGIIADNLKELFLDQNEILILHQKSFQNLPSLKTISLSNNKIESIEVDTFVNLMNLEKINLQINNLKILPENLFFNNKKLIEVKISNKNQYLEIPTKLFANLPKLKTIFLDKCNISSVPVDMFENSSTIETISLSENNLINLNETIFMSQHNLNKLILKNNSLTELNRNLFINNEKLTDLDVSCNKLTTIKSYYFENLYNLLTLHLNNNNIKDIKYNAFEHTRKLKKIDASNNKIHLENTNAIQTLTESLEELILTNNSIKELCNNNFKYLTNIKKLTLSNNLIKKVKIFVCPFKNDVKIDLTNNLIREIDMETNKENVISFKNTKYIINSNPIICDCNLIQFRNYLLYSEKNIIFENSELYCKGPENQINKKVDLLTSHELVCDLNEHLNLNFTYDLNCDYQFRTNTSNIVVNCQNLNLTEIPSFPNTNFGIELHMENNNLTNLSIYDSNRKYENLTHLYVQNNQITKFTLEKQLKFLKVLQLSDNLLETIDKYSLQKLSESPLNDLHLIGNPWRCDCKMLNLLLFVQNQSSLYTNLTCTNGTLFSQLKHDSLCKLPSNLPIIFGSIISIIFLFLLLCIIIIYFKYNLELRVLLYYYKINIIFKDVEKIDKNKKYDAFISCAIEDEKFVAETLIATLENEPYYYKIYYIHRDFDVTKNFYQEMCSAIEQSRRTIVILSPEFLCSMWKCYEFRLAHSLAIDEGRSRVIAIMLNDIRKNENLDTDMKAYLKTHSFIEYKSNWFWKKLLYQMPHKINTKI